MFGRRMQQFTHGEKKTAGGGKPTWSRSKGSSERSARKHQTKKKKLWKLVHSRVRGGQSLGSYRIHERLPTNQALGKIPGEGAEREIARGSLKRFHPMGPEKGGILFRTLEGETG